MLEARKVFNPPQPHYPHQPHKILINLIILIKTLQQPHLYPQQDFRNSILSKLFKQASCQDKQ